MTVSSGFDRVRKLVISRATGIVNVRTFLAHQRALASHPDFDPSYSQLYDFRGVEKIELAGADVDRIASSTPFGAGARRAFLVASDVAYGLARMYEALTERFEQELRVFRDLAEACLWLGIDAAALDWPGENADIVVE